MRKYNVAVIGATGSVGRELLNSLNQRRFPVNQIFAVASLDSVGKSVSFGESTIKVRSITDLNFSDIDFAFFCAGSKVSKQYAKIATSKGCTVIDKSSFFRLEDDVPLIVPEANISALKNFKAGGLIASPNCCAIPLAVALKPLDNVAKIKRVVVSTYQSVSGAGKEAMDELYLQTKAKFIFENIPPKVLPTQIAFNLIPHIGEFYENGITDEEYKIEHELKKIIGKDIKVSVTCVRVPVFVSHSMSVNIEFENKINALEAEEILSELDGIVTYSCNNEIKYATPVDVVEEDGVYISRIRDDNSCNNTINMWVTTDNLRKGAALNAVQIAEELI